MGILGDFLGSAVQGVGVGLNYLQQQKQFEYDQNLQQTMFEREDNAVQRRAADLQAAGLSQTLAAGSAASTMSPVRAQVPGAGIGNQIAENMALRSSLMRQEADISKTREEEKRIKEEVEVAKLQKEKLGYELMPMAMLLRKSAMGEISVDMSSGKVRSDNQGQPVPLAMSYMTLQQMIDNFKKNEFQKNIAGWEDISAQNNASITATNALQVMHDFGLTKNMGVRSGDKVEAAIEAAIASMTGKTGAPYASALAQLFGKIVNPLAGIIK